MKQIIILSLLLLSICISACSGPITKQKIRQDPAYSTSFTVNQPYQRVFDVLLKRSQFCYLDQPTSKQQTLVGNRDNGKKAANITLEYVYAMAEHDVILMLDITAEEETKTRVNVYASRKGDAEKVDIIQKWLDDPQNKAGCV